MVGSGWTRPLALVSIIKRRVYAMLLSKVGVMSWNRPWKLHSARSNIRIDPKRNCWLSNQRMGTGNTHLELLGDFWDHQQ
jgi:hypothetical protein